VGKKWIYILERERAKRAAIKAHQQASTSAWKIGRRPDDP